MNLFVKMENVINLFVLVSCVALGQTIGEYIYEKYLKKGDKKNE